ncbi:MAG TPA: biosynthetic peptidoglycan transglycosylase [Trichormus sp.]|jgi:penicillin-binding protein 1A
MRPRSIIVITSIVSLIALSQLTVPLLKIFLHVHDVQLPATPASGDKSTNDHHPVPLDRISLYMRQAILSAEDRHFYQHHGVDPVGLVRASIDNWRAGHMVEGASTITQQLAKVMFLDQRERTARRKLTQLIIADELEKRYSKDRILEAYLNEVYFGRGAYGIEAAAQKYFAVSAAKLSLAQAAFLAGVVRRPSDLGTPAYLEEATDIQHEVLDSMQQCGYISTDDAEDAKKQKLKFRK